MLQINGHDIEVTRGDTLVLRYTFSGREIPYGTDAIFTIKKNLRNDAFVVQKRVDASDGMATIFLDSDDTNVDARTYYWDIRLQIPREDGGYEIQTPMEYAAFTVLDVVGRGIGADGHETINPDLPVLQIMLEETKEVLARADTAVSSLEALSVDAIEADNPSATVEKHDDGSLSILFGLPRGSQGSQGLKGDKGDKGDSGVDGTSFTILALYATYAALTSAHPTGSAGAAYAVGTSESNTIYIWDVDQGKWLNVGALQGPKGEKGDKGDPGATGSAGYTPVKGMDYYTEADKAEMVNAVLAMLPTWTGGSY